MTAKRARAFFQLARVLLAVWLCGAACSRAANDEAIPPDPNAARIQPWAEDHRYWQYGGEPILPLGGTGNDNLFQWTGERLIEHLDLLASVGGNYIRNTMSDRDEGDVHAFFLQGDGRYDLDRWNEEYWRRFETLLDETARRDIIVQIEVWDRFDHSREPWLDDPYRPQNNINYGAEEVGLAGEYPKHPGRDEQPFFHTVPGMPGYETRLDKVRAYQENFVEKLLSYSLDHGNVLYCMNNETGTDAAWGHYWMRFIRDRAVAKGVNVYVTDMFDNGWAVKESEKYRRVFDQPETFLFVDLSQVNSRTFNEDHWSNIRWGIEQVAAHPRPVNHTKIYGSGFTSFGTGSPEDGVERFWRNLIAGSASARFHRPTSGNGLNPNAQASLVAARKVESLVKFWDVEARMDLLAAREEDEAYLAARPGEEYILYFTAAGSVA